MRVATAAITYWAIVFALGFVLGTARVLWVIPLVGLMPATLLELPIILAASWFASGWILRRFAITTRREALTLGVLAFAILMAAECALAGALSGETPAQWLAGLRQPHALVGLVGQAVFALMPWWRAGLREQAGKPIP